jgi:hypothetical protein
MVKTKTMSKKSSRVETPSSGSAGLVNASWKFETLALVLAASG